MKARKVNEYTTVNKNNENQEVYVYHLTGTEQELTAAHESKKSITKVVDEDNAKQGLKAGDTILYLSRYEGETFDGVITKSGYVIADRSEERKFLAMANRMGRHGKELIADYIKSKMRKAPVPTVKATETVTAQVDLGDLD